MGQDEVCGSWHEDPGRRTRHREFDHKFLGMRRLLSGAVFGLAVSTQEDITSGRRVLHEDPVSLHALAQ
jgi:hypothetical protein